MSTVMTQIVGVDERSGFSEKTQKPWSLFMVKTHDGQVFKTFRPPIGNAAKQLIGRQAQLTVGLDSKGEETLTAVEAANGQPQPTEPLPVVQQQPTPQPQVQAQADDRPLMSPTDISIVRQVTWKCVAALYAGRKEFDVDEMIEVAGVIERNINAGFLQPEWNIPF